MPKIAKKTAARRPAGNARSGPGRVALGALPEWNLNDLYAGLDDPAIKRDLERVDAECAAFEADYKGKLAALAGAPQGGASQSGAALAAAVRRYEAIDDLIGRLGSYAGLVHAGDTVDPARTKFYGDIQDRMTAASTHLLFFTLELNRIDDAALEAAMADPALNHYRPWLEDVRRYRPYQLEGSRRAAISRKIGDGVLRLEPAVRRHHRQAAFQGFGQKSRHRADAQFAPGPLRRKAQGRGGRAGA